MSSTRGLSVERKQHQSDQYEVRTFGGDVCMPEYLLTSDRDRIVRAEQACPIRDRAVSDEEMRERLTRCRPSDRDASSCPKTTSRWLFKRKPDSFVCAVQCSLVQ